ncbi:MAG: cytochrome c biogenesis protein CcdA, partial [Anaerolineae bacterium]|nr:cytochrome c biogenesis protein CcdA [Anaerolineae bacterium]
MGVAVKESTAQASAAGKVTSIQRANVMGHALMFVAGFTLVFVALGVTAGLLFSSISNIIDTLLLIGGVLLLILGIHMSGLLKWLVFKLEYGSPVQKVLATIDHRLDMLILPERRKQAGLGQSPGYIRSGVVGMTFAAGWTPCIGPLLGAIFGLSLNVSRAAEPTTVLIQSGVLFFAYALGLAVPFVLAAWALSKAT